MSNTAPRTSTRICSVDELPLGEARRFVVEGNDICVAHCASGFFAIDEWCSHGNYPFSEGDLDVDTCEIECPGHGSYFSLTTGEPESLPATEAVTVYKVGIEGSDVVVYGQ